MALSYMFIHLSILLKLLQALFPLAWRECPTFSFPFKKKLILILSIRNMIEIKLLQMLSKMAQLEYLQVYFVAL